MTKYLNKEPFSVGVTRAYADNWERTFRGAKEQDEVMKLVYLESPYAGDVEVNLRYARACMADCFKRNEAPFVSHCLYTQPGVLDDNIKAERELGIRAGFEWGKHAEKTVVYSDLGISAGMKAGIEGANRAGRPVENRSLVGWTPT